MRAICYRDSKIVDRTEIKIGGSKSESNRLLILQALYPNISIENLSDSDDTVLLRRALDNSSPETIDIHHAGTAMRFLTAYFASRPGTDVVLTGSDRMKQRPIEILVNALKGLGAHIDYLENEGFPPLRIKGRSLVGSSVTLSAGVSSQYISALLLIAPSINEGLTINLEGPVTSRPYIEMTCELLRQIGAQVSHLGNSIRVHQLKAANPQVLEVESDWSSASYFYSLVALSEGLTIKLTTFKSQSLQGDANLSEIYKEFGVQTHFYASDSSMSLIKSGELSAANMVFDLTETPDIAQTIAVTCFGLGIGCELTGLHTLKIKETDRLQALKTELEKLGAHISVTDDSLTLKPSNLSQAETCIKTYNDHRMAMAFAPLGLKTKLCIEDPEVVSKSFPKFWETMADAGLRFKIER